MTDPTTIAYTAADGTRRRVRYEPRLDAGDWWRVEEEHTGTSWRTVGREPVEDVTVETIPEVVR